ncbi:MAG: PEGA domain-containing protein [Planctomycetaceae bacterium]|nr:PEGA domain-containing protein [Planctomycetaceae bacterium]
MPIRHYTILGFVTCTVLWLTACASDRYNISIDSEPPGAQIFVDGKHQGTTPTNLYITRGGHQLRLELDGYTPRDFELPQTPHYGLEGEAIFYPRDQFHFTLEKE